MFDAIIVIIGALLAMFSVAVLAYPLVRSRSLGQPEIAEAAGEDGLSELDSIYESIRTLQLEYGLGKVGEDLYRQQMNDYRLRAATALRRRDERQTDAAVLLEQQVLLARATLVDADGNPAVGSGPCPSCGGALDQKTAECPQCAAKIDVRGPDLP
jgi:hypothetical protein